MSGVRRDLRFGSIALAALVLSHLALPSVARAGSGGVRPSPVATRSLRAIAPTAAGAICHRSRWARATIRMSSGNGVLDPGVAGVAGSQAASEESRSTDDFETEIEVDTAPAKDAEAPAAADSRVASALAERASRGAYLFTAHRRF